MKKFLASVAVGALATVLAAPAQALSLSSGPLQIHLRDATSLYAGETPIAEPTGPGAESRSVATIDNIVFASGAPGIALGEGELSALSFDLFNVDINATDPENVRLYFGRLASSTDAGQVGKVRMYLDPTPEDNNGNGSVDILDVMNPANDGAGPTHFTNETFLGVNSLGDDATLWLDMEFVPFATRTVGGNLYDIYLRTDYDTTLGEGNATLGYLKIVGGSAASLFAKDVYNTPLGGKADFTIDYGLIGPPNDTYLNHGYARQSGWPLESDDPLKGTAVPEPTSLALLGMGVVSLLGYRRRK